MCITRCERVCVVRVQLKEMYYICYIFLKKKQFFDVFSYNIIIVFLVCFQSSIFLHTLFFGILFRFPVFLNLQLKCTINMYMFLCV